MHNYYTNEKPKRKNILAFFYLMSQNIRLFNIVNDLFV
jgi:hypothetical protein